MLPVVYIGAHHIFSRLLTFSTFLLMGWVVNAVSPLHAQNLKSPRRQEFKFERLSVEHGLSQCTVGAIFQDSRGFLWFGTADGLNRYDGYSFKHYKHDPSDTNSLSGNDISAIAEDQSGRLWIGTAGGGLNKFDRQRGKFIRYKHKPEDHESLSSNMILVIYMDTFGMLWIGTDAGLNAFDPKTEKFIGYQHDVKNPNGLSHNVINAIYEDKAKALWIVTAGGLDQFDRKTGTFEHFIVTPHPEEGIHVIHEDHTGTFRIGMTQSGLKTFDRRTKTFLQHDQHDPRDSTTLCDNLVNSICEDLTGALWVGTKTGLNRFDRERENFTNYRNEAGKRLGLSREGISAICEDKQGNLWVGGDGLKKYDRRKGQLSFYMPQLDNPNSLSHRAVTTIYEDRKGRLWIGTQNGLNQFDGASETFTRYLNDPANPHSLGHNYVKTFFEDQAGNLWIGTTDGLNKLDLTTETFTRYYEKDGLPNTFIYGVLGDDHGNLWMSTNKGLSKFNPVTKKFRNYDLKDGLQSYEFNTGAYHRSKRTGEMFFGGINGINIFHPDSVKDDPYVPPIVLTDFKKLDLPVELDGDVAELEEIKIAYQDNVFSFEFAALDFTHPEKNQYAYMLEGVDRDWVHCGTRRFARYTNLDPGRYTFKVKGTNHDGVWNERGASLKIIIVPPFWMTWWFRTLAAVVVLGAFAGAVRYFSLAKLRRRLELEKERTRISKDMHDEIGAGLTKVAILSELAQRDCAHPEKLETHLQKISETAHELVDNISEIIWAINPQNNAFDNLAVYLRKYAAHYFEMTPVRYRLDFPEAAPGYPISAEFRRHIFMVVKEAIHNIVKHAKATEVEMQMVSYDHTLEIQIHDNGRGFSPETVNGGGNGLRNMSKRMAEVGGKFEIQSQPSQGTTVRIFAAIK
jgi:ligand-binding sensor domain-containing protein/signal transduction histidine kinase